MQQILPEITSLRAQLIAVSPQLPDQSLPMIEKNAIAFEVLSDIGNKVARDFGLVYTVPEELRPIYKNFGIDLPAANADDTFELPLPATYVIGQDGIITLAFADADYTTRLEPSEIITALKNMK